MQCVTLPTVSARHRRSIKRREGRKFLAYSTILAPLLLAVEHSNAANTVYTYTPDGLTTDTWSSGTGWSPSAPASGTNSELSFFPTSTSVTNVNSDDYAGAFNLNALDLSGSLPASGSSSITINATGAGAYLNFANSSSGSAPVVNLSASNTSGSGVLSYVVNAPIALANNLQMNASGFGTYTFAGNISGGAGLSIVGTSSTYNSLAVNIAGTNSYTGITTISPNSPPNPSNISGGNTITVNVSGNQTGATGGWYIGANNNYGVANVNFSAGSQVAIAAGKIFQLGPNSASGATMTLNAAGTVSNAGTLDIFRTAVFNVSSGGVWNQSGPMNFNVPSGGNSSTMNVLAGGIFNYNGATPIAINPAAAAAGRATLTIGGIFNTSQGFTDAGSTSTGYSTISLNGGQLMLAPGSNIGTLATTPLIVSLVSGTVSTINTAGATGTNTIASNISGGAASTTGINITGGGTVTFAGSSYYAAATQISNGTLAIATANSLPATTVIQFNNTTATSTLNITGLNQSIGGMTFGTQTTGTNTDTITGNSATSLTLNASGATTLIAPANVSNASLTLDMSSLGGFTYNNPGGTLEIGPLINTGTSPSELVKLASNTDQITAGTLNVGYQGTGSTTSPSTLILGANTTLDVNNLAVGSSGSRASGYINAGSGTLTIAGQAGGSSLAAVVIGRSDNTGATSGATTSILDTSAGTLNAQLSTVIIGESQPNTFTTSSRGVTINANFKMGLGNLSANSLTIGLLQADAADVGLPYSYTELVNGSFNMTGGTATIPTITLGTSAYAANFNTTSPSIINAVVTLNSGSVLNSTTIAEGTITPYALGTLIVNPQLNWNDGAINNIAGNGLTIGSTVAINVASPGNHAFNISSGQTGSVAGVINGSGGVNVIGLGTVTFGGANLYSGATNISSGGLLAGSANTLSPNSVINILGGTLDATSGANTIAGLNATSAGTLNLSIGSILAVSGTASFSGALNLSGTAGTLPQVLISYASETGMFTAGSVVGVPMGDVLAYTPTALEIVNPNAGPGNLIWTDASGDNLWNTTSINFNSSAGTPVAYNDGSGTGDNVSFTDANNGNYNVTINAVVHPSSTTVNNSSGTYTFNGSAGIAGAGSLVKLGSSGLALYTSNSYTGGTNISGGTVSLYNAQALPSFGSVTIASGAKLTATPLGASYLLQIGSLSLATGGTIDLKNNAADIRGSSLATVWSQVQSGYASGTWTGTGITSSAAATGSLTALGVIINDSLANTGTSTGTAIYSNFSGGAVADGDVLVKYTYYGDANLDGHVDASDYSLIDNGYLNHLTGWFNGDFNYDGVVNGSDYTLMDNAFNTQGAAIADAIATPTAQIAGGAASAVPEPASLSLLCLGVTGLLSRRRRQN